MSRRKKMYGRRRKRSVFKDKSEIIKTAVQEGVIGGVEKLSGTGSNVLSKVGRVAPGVGLAATLYGFYKSGQDKSGGKVGYVKNPNAKEGGAKHGSAESGAQFIPGGTTVKTHKPSIWDNKKSIF